MIKRLPPLYALRAFEQAAKHGSFTAAAQSLSLTPSAISHHIKTLEESFDCKLFIRSGPRLEITEAGRIFATHLEEGFIKLQRACELFSLNSSEIRIKAPSTLTMKWLIDAAHAFESVNLSLKLQISSIWKNFDWVDFEREHYDCAILLGNGYYGQKNESRKLFDEWIIPICSPELKLKNKMEIPQNELIHPSIDRRDWRHWLQKAGKDIAVNLDRGKVFDTFEQGCFAAILGHGISIGDLVLSYEAITQGQLIYPFPEAVTTGNAYYLVWPSQSNRTESIETLYQFLLEQIPRISIPGLKYLK
ncbi:MAG: Glycine cleavage system transcriptional activator [Candidatus Celerinatantimonas neptuna]|nr:MAG: Glycine cleavage system transcriptional activator [Candidatus Celerinatantimonas neptuna]